MGQKPFQTVISLEEALIVALQEGEILEETEEAAIVPIPLIAKGQTRIAIMISEIMKKKEEKGKKEKEKPTLLSTT